MTALIARISLVFAVGTVVAGCARSEGESNTESAAESSASEPSRYLYVWAGTGHDSTAGLNMITVLDADPTRRRMGPSSLLRQSTRAG